MHTCVYQGVLLSSCLRYITMSSHVCKKYNWQRACTACVEGCWAGPRALLHVLYHYVLRAKIMLVDFNLAVSTPSAKLPNLILRQIFRLYMYTIKDFEGYWLYAQWSKHWQLKGPWVVSCPDIARSLTFLRWSCLGSDCLAFFGRHPLQYMMSFAWSNLIGAPPSWRTEQKSNRQLTRLFFTLYTEHQTCLRKSVEKVMCSDQWLYLVTMVTQLSDCI